MEQNYESLLVTPCRPAEGTNNLSFSVNLTTMVSVPICPALQHPTL